MKHLILSTLLLVLCSIGYAQVNLREGIVITLAGDTLHGDIDYRTDAMNAEHCSFIQDGQSEVHTYRPGEIYGYRFIDNGRFYVSKEVTNENGKSEMFFLEFVVRGKLNLYYKGDNVVKDIFYFEDEKGKLTSLNEQSTLEQTYIRRKNLSKALYAVKESKRAQDMLWKNDVNRHNTIEAVIAYNDDTCPDGECEVYQYKKKRTPRDERPIQWAIKAGYDIYGIKLLKEYRFLEVDCDCDCDFDYFSAAHISTGMDIYGPRLCSGLLAEVYLSYIYCNGTSQQEIYADMPGKEKIQATFHEFQLKTGVGYQWQQLKIQPRVRFGGTASMFNYTYDLKELDKKPEMNSYAYLGLYMGTGVVFPQGQHAWTLDVDYSFLEFKWYNIRRLQMSVGYQF